MFIVVLIELPSSTPPGLRMGVRNELTDNTAKVRTYFTNTRLEQLAPDSWDGLREMASSNEFGVGSYFRPDAP